MQRSLKLGLFLTLFASAANWLLGCTSRDPESETFGTERGALVGSLSITGQVQDANGLPIGGVKVTLAGSANQTKTTDSSGNYAFTGLASGSYSVKPTRTGCTFLPDVVNLNNMTTSKVQYFSSSGTACGGSSNVNTGATTGSFAIAGVLTDATGKKIVGGRVNLSGTATAVRFSDFSGRYTFHVNAGTYTLTAAGSCALSPATATFNNVNGNRTQNFSASGASCVSSQALQVTSVGQFAKIRQGTTESGLTVTTVEQRASAAAAVAKLSLIAAERPGTVRSLVIGGNPAIEREEPIAPPARAEHDEGDGGSYGITTAVAVGSRVVRFESRVPENPSAATINTFLLAGRNFGVENIDALHGSPPVPIALTHVTGPLPALAPPLFGPSASGDQEGELQVAVSGSNPSSVVGTNPARMGINLPPIYSPDFGLTHTRATQNFVNPPGFTTTQSRSDPSVAAGAYNGISNNFYYSQVVVPFGANASIALGVSTDDGKTFNDAGVPFPVDCTTDGLHGSCVTPDQAQLAADKYNRVNNSDQLYLVWRNFSEVGGTGGSLMLEMACSKDGGQSSWVYNTTGFIADADDWPRIAVAQDGTLLVAFAHRATADDPTYDLKVQRFSSCTGGLQKVYTEPLQVAHVTEVSPMAGMGRRPLANFGIAAGDGAGGTDTMYVTWVTESSPGNDDVFVSKASLANGVFSTPTHLNDVTTGARYFPAICTTNDVAFIAWYDRRLGDDRTAYYRRTLHGDGGVLGAEFNVSGAGHEDPQCLTGFGANGVNAVEGETSCTNLPAGPVPAGTCQLDTCCDGCSPGDPNYCTQSRCDLRPGLSSCTSGETCRVPLPSSGAVGQPTYGDYNGIGCAQGRAVLAWATTTPPRGGKAFYGVPCTFDVECDSGACNGSGACAATKEKICNADGQSCSIDTDCCSLRCLGGACLRTVGVYLTSALSRAMSVHADCSGTVTLTDTSSVTTPYPATEAFDFTVGDDASNQGSFLMHFDPFNAGNMSMGFVADPGGLRVNGFGYVIGEELVNTGATELIPADTPTLFTGSTSGGFEPGSPFVGGTIQFSCTVTATAKL